MLKKKIHQLILDAVNEVGLEVSEESKDKISINYPDPAMGDYATNAALILAKDAKMKPIELAEKLIEKIDKSDFEKVEVAGPGFINFRIKLSLLTTHNSQLEAKGEKILVEYFQPNVAKPMHMGLLMNAVIGDNISRMMKYLGYQIESDTHMGDWGTQFGFVILAYKKYGNETLLEVDPINELNKLYVKINAEAEKHPQLHDEAKQEFVKLEKGDPENRALWKKFVDLSLEKFLKIDEIMNIQPFDHHWPESFYEDKMAKIVFELQTKGLLKESQGAKIVDLENQGLGVALVVKSDGGTTYLLRDLATFVYRKSLGFKKQIYVIDVRQAHAFMQLFTILKMLGEMDDGEGIHIDYGFMSFKGDVLSTRKGNMVLLEEVLSTAKEKVKKIISEKNPNLEGAPQAVSMVARGSLKYFILKHNRHSDIEFDWEKVLDFEGDSGPYLQYTHARLASILRKVGQVPNSPATTRRRGEAGKFDIPNSISSTEREILFKTSLLPEIVEDSVKDFMPNVLANYLYELASLINKFYHESPVVGEKNEELKNFRIGLVSSAKTTLAKGLELLGIEPLEEM